jgi:tRNA dimethylallyltransferase
VVAGGTPLYTKLLIEGISAGPPRDETLRAELQAAYRADPAAVWSELERADPTYAAGRHRNDERRIVRALEVFRLTGKPYSSFHTTDGQRRADLRPLLIGLHWERPVLHQRIAQRTREIFARGLVDEVRRLRPRLSREALQAVGYKEVCALLDGACSLAACVAAVEAGTRQLAKHQLTWYRRFADIRWIPGDAPDRDTQALALCRAHLP